MRLLVVSPSKVFWRGVHNALRGLKHITITECDSGVSALKKLRNDRFDMLLLDAGLNEMTGLEFLDQFNVLVEEDQRCPLLYFSGQASLDEVLETVERGIDDFIVMPYDNEVLRKKLDRQVKRITESRRLPEPGEATFVPQPDAVPLDEIVPVAEVNVAAPPALPVLPDDDLYEDEATRRKRYTRRTTIGIGG